MDNHAKDHNKYSKAHFVNGKYNNNVNQKMLYQNNNRSNYAMINPNLFEKRRKSWTTNQQLINNQIFLDSGNSDCNSQQQKNNHKIRKDFNSINTNYNKNILLNSTDTHDYQSEILQEKSKNSKIVQSSTKHNYSSSGKKQIFNKKNKSITDIKESSQNPLIQYLPASYIDTKDQLSFGLDHISERARLIESLNNKCANRHNQKQPNKITTENHYSHSLDIDEELNYYENSLDEFSRNKLSVQSESYPYKEKIQPILSTKIPIKNFSIIENDLKQKEPGLISSIRLKKGLYGGINNTKTYEENCNINQIRDAHSITDIEELRGYTTDLEIENKEKDAEIIRLNMLIKDLTETLRKKQRQVVC